MTSAQMDESYLAGVKAYPAKTKGVGNVELAPKLQNGVKVFELTADELDELLASKTPLAFYRKRAGLTQAALAKSAGIAQGFLSEIEAGRKTGDIHTLRRIADALGISLDDLVAAEAPAESTPKRRAARSR